MTGAPKKQKAPLCVRFRSGTRQKIHDTARKAGRRRSAWIRYALTNRSEQVLSNHPLPELFYDTAHGKGEPICIRLKPNDLDKIKQAAEKENVAVSAWIRACLMQELESAP